MLTSGRVIPFPTFEEYGDGARQMEDIARAANAILLGYDTSVPALKTRPAALIGRTTNQSPDIPPGISVPLNMNVITKDNASLCPGDGTITTGNTSHPALWQVQAHVGLTSAGAESTGTRRILDARAKWTDPVTGRITEDFVRWKTWSNNVGGEILVVDYVFRTIAKTTFYSTVFHNNGATNMTAVAGMYLCAVRIGAIP